MESWAVPAGLVAVQLYTPSSSSVTEPTVRAVPLLLVWMRVEEGGGKGVEPNAHVTVGGGAPEAEHRRVTDAPCTTVMWDSRAITSGGTARACVYMGETHVTLARFAPVGQALGNFQNTVV